MKILCVIDSLSSGGAQRQLVELALGFKEYGHQISFLTYHHIPFYNSALESNGISISCIHTKSYIRRLLSMRRFIRKGNYDAVLAFLEAASFICEISGFPYRKWKLVVGERNANPNIEKSVKLRIFRWFHLFADFIVANSYANMKIIRKVNPWLPQSKCKVFYNIVDFSRWKPIDDFTFQANGKIKIVVAARQNYQKNLNGLVDAILLLSEEERSKLEINWYGDSIVEPYLDNSFMEAYLKIKLHNIENIITFHPATHDITGIIQKSDAVGLFSFYEGFPNAVCEGMACRKPVISSAVSDLPVFLPYDSNLLCDPESAHSIKKALSYLINLSDDQFEQIGLNNESIAKERFRRQDIVVSYLRLFDS